MVLMVDETRGPHGGQDPWSSWWMRSVVLMMDDLFVVLMVDEIHGPHDG